MFLLRHFIASYFNFLLKVSLCNRLGVRPCPTPSARSETCFTSFEQMIGMKFGFYTLSSSHFFFFFATESSVCFLFHISSQVGLLSGLFPFPKTLPFVAWAQSPPTHQFPTPPGLLTLPPVLALPSSLLGGKSGPSASTFQSRGRKRLCQGCDLASEGGKAQNGPATHCPPPTSSSSGVGAVPGLDELIHSASTRRVQWEETFCKSKK